MVVLRWRYSTVLQEVPWRYSTVTQEVPWRYCTVTQEVLWRYSTVTQEVPWLNSTVPQEAPWRYSTITQEVLWRYITITKEVPRWYCTDLLTGRQPFYRNQVWTCARGGGGLEVHGVAEISDSDSDSDILNEKEAFYRTTYRPVCPVCSHDVDTNCCKDSVCTSCQS